MTKIHLDTDMGSDLDDVSALAVLLKPHATGSPKSAASWDW
jgi:hypothetical protein